MDTHKSDVARLEHELNRALADASETSAKLYEASAKLAETEEALAEIKEEKESLETGLSAVQQEKADVQVRQSCAVSALDLLGDLAPVTESRSRCRGLLVIPQ